MNNEKRNNYQSFLESKRLQQIASGMDVAENDLNSILYPFQKRITQWALRMGRAAIFADCGLGKTFMQIEWARLIHERESGDVLIVAPLAVSLQTIGEAARINVKVNKARAKSDIQSGINITNYEMVEHLKDHPWTAIVLDESSILKSYSGKYRQELTDMAKTIPYRLCCTATPAPNDLIEIVNHAEFLGVMTGKEVKAMFFKQDGDTSHWKLKGHAQKEFWKWMASWAVAVRSPSDIGFEDDGFILPTLNIHEHIIIQEHAPNGMLFPLPGITLNEQRANRRATIDDRVQKAIEIINADSDEAWLIWCDLNDESAEGKASFNAIEVKGADTNEHKEQALIGFAHGEIKRLITKPKIAGFGMNWQNCANVIFLGISHSYEQFYQAIRRVWRFGQKRPVNIHVIIADTDYPVLQNIRRKEKQGRALMDGIIHEMQGIQLDRVKRGDMQIEIEHNEGDGWEMWRGDSIELADKLKADSVGLSIFSPPFPGMYVYTNSAADVGNSKTIEELMKHFKFLMPKILAATMPGRSCLVHLCQGVAFKWIDGYIGVKDFRGAVIKAMEDAGWIYYGETTIDKNPQIKAIRTKDQGLLFKTLSKDASNLHCALADYLIQFRKPGENPKPIKAGISEKYNKGHGWITADEWIRWARPVWYADDWAPDGDGISETKVLNVRQAKDANDEKHLCPLQLGVIERGIKLWSNPNDLVFSPFAGIGSEGYKAIQLGRRFVGIELKESYYRAAVRNLQNVTCQGGLFDTMENCHDNP